ncbi:MAG: hypothetical protein ACE5GX_14570 [Thermoanaerobaculia bacterium]
MKITIQALLVAFPMLVAPASAQLQPPIIDMHLHALPFASFLAPPPVGMCVHSDYKPVS